MRFSYALLAVVLLAGAGCSLATSDDIQPGTATVLGHVTRSYGSMVVHVSCANGRIKTSLLTDSSGTFSLSLNAPPELIRETGPWISCTFEVTNAELLAVQTFRQIRFNPPGLDMSFQTITVFGP